MPSATTSSENQLEMNQHDGEEFIYVLEGILTVYLDGSEYCLNPGDSIQIHPRPRMTGSTTQTVSLRF